MSKEEREILYHVEQINPFPFIVRWRVYDKDHKWIATFKEKNDAIAFGNMYVGSE